MEICLDIPKINSKIAHVLHYCSLVDENKHNEHPLAMQGVCAIMISTLLTQTCDFSLYMLIRPRLLRKKQQNRGLLAIKLIDFSVHGTKKIETTSFTTVLFYL